MATSYDLPEIDTDPLSTTGNRATSSWRDRVLVARIGDRDWGFPAPWVSEIIVINRSQIMPLPFYDPTILGVIHHQGKLVTLADGQRLLSELSQQQARAVVPEQLTVMALGPSAPHLSGVGIMVDRVLGSESAQAGASSASAPNNSWKMVDPDSIHPHLWHPLRWQASDE